MRKLSILLLVLLSAAMAFAGSQPEKPAATTTAPAATAAPYTGKLPLSAEKVTLRFATHQDTASAMAKPSNDLPVYQQLEKITNVHIEWETVPYNSYKEVMTTRIAAGSDLPDILNLSFLGNYQKLAADGIIIPQNDLIKQYGYYINEFFKTNAGYKAMMTAPDGNIYCVENTVLDSHLSVMPMINKYAMQRVGLGMPTTAAEFTNLLKAFRDKDINGNGQKDEVPFVTQFDQNNALYIFHCLRWQSEHEIKLGSAPAAFKCKPHGLLKVFLCDVFVNYIAQSLRSGFRSECQSAFACFLCFMHNIQAE